MERLRFLIYQKQNSENLKTDAAFFNFDELTHSRKNIRNTKKIKQNFHLSIIMS
jgi:hypothetical protein